MSWLALLLIGIGLADLGHSIRPVRRWPETIAAMLVLAVAVAADLTEPADLAALVLIVGVVLAWGWTVRDAFGRDRAWLPLTVLLVALAAALAGSVYAGEAGGAVQRWLDATPIPVLEPMSADAALLLAGVLLVQLSTGNVIVRLVLRATGTVDPARGAAHDATRTLKGGRLLGPMERVFIVCLGVAGYLTAASIVIAAKGLLRFPELQAKRDDTLGPTIDEVTEYFLVGSFVSWSISLACLVLVG